MNAYAWDDLAVGMTATFEAVVTDGMMESFAELSGDRNPLHVDPGEARGRGFPDRVVYGMLTSAFYSRLAGMHLPGRYCLLHGMRLDFVAPVHVGERLTISGTVSHRSEAVRQVEIRATIQNESGSVVSKATIRAGVADAG